MHNQRYTLHLAEFLWRERFLSRRFLGSSAWELPAVWLLADLIANVHHSSSMKNITGPLMRATNTTHLDTLRKNCFPGVPAVPRPAAPAVPAVPVQPFFCELRVRLPRATRHLEERVGTGEGERGEG